MDVQKRAEDAAVVSSPGSDEQPVPGVYDGPDSQPGTLLYELDVDGEVFAVRAWGGGTYYDWVSGRNEDYGFSTTGPPDQPPEEHRRSIRIFLSMIDPATGYIAED